MKCPKCRAEMEKVDYQGIEVDRCTACEGIWFDSLEEEKLAALAGSEQVDTGDPETGNAFNDVERIDCPVCRTPMIRMVAARQPHIWLESCKVCYGVFFDAGEFTDYKDHSLIDRLRALFTRERD